MHRRRHDRSKRRDDAVVLRREPLEVLQEIRQQLREWLVVRPRRRIRCRRGSGRLERERDGDRRPGGGQHDGRISATRVIVKSRMIKTSAERRSATNIQALLKKLQIEDVNAGACSGPNGWIDEADAAPLVSMNPATGEPIAAVRLASSAAYDAVVAEAARAFPDVARAPGAEARRARARSRQGAARAARSRSAISSRSRWARSARRATAKCRR